MSKVIVTFEKNWRGYAAGETAGFDIAVAQSLVDGGYAVEAGKSSSKKGKTAAASTSTTQKPGADSSNSGASSGGTQTGSEGKP